LNRSRFLEGSVPDQRQVLAGTNKVQ